MADGTTIASTPYVQTTIPNAGEAIGNGLSQGMQLGVNLALARQRLDLAQKQHQMQYQEHLGQVAQRQNELLKGFPDMSPQQQKLMMPTYNKLAGITGSDVMTPEFQASVNGDTEAAANAFATLPNDVTQWKPEHFQILSKYMRDPEQRGKYLGELHTLHQRGIDESIRATGEAAKATNTANATKARTEIEVLRNDTVKRGQDLADKYHEEMNRINDEYKRGMIDHEQAIDRIAKQNADTQAQLAGIKQQLADIAKAKAPSEIAKNTGQADAAESQVPLNQAKTTGEQVKATELPKSNAEKVRHNKAMESLTAGKLDIAKSRLSTTDKKTELTAINQIDNQAKNYRDMTGLGRRAQNLLDQPDMTPGRFKEGITSLTALMRGTISRIPGGTEAGVGKAYSDAADGLENLYTRWIANNPGRNSFDDATKANLKTDINRLFESAHQQYRGTIAQGLKVRAGALAPGRAEQIAKDYGVSLDEAGTGVMKPFAAPSKPSFAPAQLQLMIQKGGAAYTKKYLMQKGYSDAEATAAVGGK